MKAKKKKTHFKHDKNAIFLIAMEISPLIAIRGQHCRYWRRCEVSYGAGDDDGRLANMAQDTRDPIAGTETLA